MPKITQPVSERPVLELKPGSKNGTHLTPSVSAPHAHPARCALNLWVAAPCIHSDRDAAYESWQACMDMMAFSSFTIFPLSPSSQGCWIGGY